jgi:hypothetical protein
MYTLIDWCLMPTSAVFQLYRSVLYTQGYKIKIVFCQIVPSDKYFQKVTSPNAILITKKKLMMKQNTHHQMAKHKLQY